MEITDKTKGTVSKLILGVIGSSLKFITNIQEFFGNYDVRVRQGLIDTGENLVSILYPDLHKKKKAKKKFTKKEQLTYHYCRQWRANRKKLK